jgi:hypothetical protein
MRCDRHHPTAIKHVTGTKMKSQAAGKMGFATSEVGGFGGEGALRASNVRARSNRG